MTVLGTMKLNDDAFSGKLETLSVTRDINIKPTGLTDENAPDYRVFSGNGEVGAGWVRTSKKGNQYICLKLDDPSFYEPIYVNLLEGDDDYFLVWNR